MSDHDTRHLDGKDDGKLQLFAEDLDMEIYVPIDGDNFPNETEAQIYNRQCAFIDTMTTLGNKANNKIAVLDLSEDGVTVLVRFNPILEENLGIFIDGLSIIAEVKVEYTLVYTDPDAGYFHHDVKLVEESRHYILLTDEEMYELYAQQGDNCNEPF